MCFTCIWASGASPGGLWRVPGDLLAALGCLLGSPGPSWAGLGVFESVLSGSGERLRAVGNYRAPRKPLQVKSKSRLSRLLLISTSNFIFIYTSVDPCIKCTRSKLDTGQGVLGLVAPEDLLLACCLVLPLVLSALVLSPLVPKL